MGRSEQLYSRADQAKQAARACGRAAAAAALTTIAAIAAHALGGIALALVIVAAFLTRRIVWSRIEKMQRKAALGAELWESFQTSNWRERTGWGRAAAVAAFAVALQIATPSSAAADTSGIASFERRTYAALADAEGIRVRMWAQQATAITESVAARRSQGTFAQSEIAAFESERAVVAARATFNAGILEVAQRRPDREALTGETKVELDRRALALATDRAILAVLAEALDARLKVNAAVAKVLDPIVAATERATELRAEALALTQRGDPRASAVVFEADAAERAALALASEQGLAVPAAFRLTRPTIGEVSSPFGPRGSEFHDGTDFAAPLGAPVVASAAGVVVTAGRPYLPADDAVVVIVDHGNGLKTLYGHLMPGVSVRAGQRVEPGTLLGRAGVTGRVTGPHLHFALYFQDRPIDAARLGAVEAH